MHRDTPLSRILMVSAIFVGIATAYTVSGNQIFDPNGKLVILRGLDRPSLEWSCTGQQMSLADYALMKSWGANIIRLSLSQCCLLAGLNGYSASYASVIDQQVTWIKSLGMGVILDLHWSNQGSASTTCGQQPMADTYSIQFWTQVATKYKNDPWIAFELYNEPYLTDWNIWKNGGSYQGYTVAGMQQLYNTVRATGANNAVIVGGINYAYDLSGVANYPIQGTNIIYNTHPYNYGGKQPNEWQASFGYLLPTHAVIATEFGDTTSCDTTYYANFLNFTQTHHMSWTGWGWWVSGCSFPSLISDWKGTPSASGVLVKAALLKGSGVAGTPSTTTAAASTSQTTLLTALLILFLTYLI
eukprot:TRINITY_DN918_c0_g1_i1.p1 TRINITY_DN918_c0_g1~~TRINITY_DN918_c0_g1_i1.p1  ORF type:complete len:357 (+),score=49.78 TRINITY_DN918_c0_g1_i1:100-1170(+)